MTTPNNLCDTREEVLSGRVVPQIEFEEDIPFPLGGDEQAPTKSMLQKPLDQKLGQTEDIENELRKNRFSTGKVVLFVAMAAMAVLVGIDLVALHFWQMSSDLVESAFEAFKLITMTVMGYIFGSTSSK